MFSERNRLLETKIRSGLTLLNQHKLSFAKSQIYMNLKDVWHQKQCLIGQSDCPGFTVAQEWTTFPVPVANLCQCKIIASSIDGPISCYLLDALQKVQSEFSGKLLNMDAWTVLNSSQESSAQVLRAAFLFLSHCKMSTELLKLSQRAQTLVAVSQMFFSDKHILLDWNDLVSSLSAPKNMKTQVSIHQIFAHITSQKTIVLHMGDYKFRMKSRQSADTDLFERLIVELDNKKSPLIVVSQQALFKQKDSTKSLLDFNYQNDTRERIQQTNSKQRFTSTRRTEVQSISVLECLAADVADRLLGLLAEGQRVLDYAQNTSS